MNNKSPRGMKIIGCHSEQCEVSPILREISRHSPRNDWLISEEVKDAICSGE